MNHLQSMESGIADELPESVYVAGFIKRYAEVVGLNGQALSDEYRSERASDSGGNGNGHFAKPKAVKGSAAPLVVTSAPYTNKTRIDSGAPSLMKMMVFPALSVVMLISLIALLLKWHSDSSANQPDPSLLSLASKYNTVPATAPNVGAPTTAPTQPLAPATTDSSVVLTASKHVWVNVKAMSNGESLYTGFLEAGDRRDYKDSEGIRVHAGNGGSVTVEVNGKSETLGQNGKITERTFSTRSAAAPATASSTTTAATGSSATSSTTGSASTTSTLTTPKVVKKPIVKKAEAPRRKKLDETSSRRYIPGEGLGGGRSIDVPYRYTEGRLDTDQ